MIAPSLSLLIFLPVVVAVILVLFPAALKNIFKVAALGVSVVQSIGLVFLMIAYTPGPAFQFVERKNWIQFDLGTGGLFKVEYFLGVDGMGITMIALSIVILLIATLASWKQNENAKGYFVLLLILNGAVIGSFCALDLLLFYVFFEFLLIPMYFLIGIWGGAKREYASVKFFLYTLLGSILILIVFIGLFISAKDPTTPNQLAHTFAITNLTDASNYVAGSVLDPSYRTRIGPWTTRMWAFLLLLIGFGIKLPIVPLHTWLPDAHVEAPTAISVILASLLLKVGAYGLLRIVLPVFPLESVQAAWLLGLLGVVTIWYGALNAMACKDLKRLIAYSSVSHMGFVLLGLASFTTEGVVGSVYQMFSHGLISAILFLLAGVLYDRTNDRTIENYSGLAAKMKSYTGFILLAFFASMGLPGFSGFIAELAVLVGAFRSPSFNGLLSTWMPMLATLGLAATAGYYIWTLQRMFFGPLSSKKNIEVLDDLRTNEYIFLIPLVVLVVIFGIFPQPLMDIIEPFARQLVFTVTGSN